MIRRLVILAVGMFIFVPAAAAQNWAGAVGGNWATNGNWTNGLPGTGGSATALSFGSLSRSAITNTNAWTAGTYSGPADAASLDSATAFDTSGFANLIAGRFRLNLDAGRQSLSIVYTPAGVPEPGSLVLTAAVGAASAAIRWRRRPNAVQVRRSSALSNRWNIDGRDVFRLRLVLPAALMLCPAVARAGTYVWTSGSGTFQLPTNWNNAGGTTFPGPADTAEFVLNNAYTVSFNASALTTGFLQQQGDLTLAIGSGVTYQVTGTDGFTVGSVGGQTANLEVSSGTLNVTASNGGMATGGIGVVAGSSGSLTIRSGAAFTTNSAFDVGVSGTGSLTISGSATIGARSLLGFYEGATGQVFVMNGGTLVAPS
jgi:T5SS/PEP-CTERM-associated repeat protein